jgi:hypothetical protein
MFRRAAAGSTVLLERFALGGGAELIALRVFFLVSGRSTLDGRLFCEFRDDSGYYASKRGFELDFAAFGGSFGV